MKRIVTIVMTFIMVISLVSCGRGEATSIVEVKEPKSYGFNKKNLAYKNNEVSTEFLSNVIGFSGTVMQEVLSKEEEGNIVISPLSLYMALSLAAAGADGETKENMLETLQMDKLGVDDMNEMTGNLYQRMYTDNKIGKLRIGNSLWCQDGVSFKKEYLESAKEDYYASVFSVDFSQNGVGEEINKWISQQTEGNLESNNSIPKDQVMALINTVYFYDQWVDRFDVEKTKEDIFHCPNGDEVTCDFMNRLYGSHGFVDGENYLASSLSMKNGCRMTFILPNEGVDMNSLIDTREKVIKMVKATSSRGEQIDGAGYKNGKVTFKIPKFDFQYGGSLKESLMDIGMTEAFKEDANFKNMIEEDIAYISDINQSVQISIDEIGCQAAVFTEMIYCGAAEPLDEAEMVLDRPFMFMVSSYDGIVLFAGIVNDPTE